MTDILTDYLIRLAAVDNENELTGKKKQMEWEKEMVDPVKFAEWQAQYTIKQHQQTVKIPNKTITLKNMPACVGAADRDKKPNA